MYSKTRVYKVINMELVPDLQLVKIYGEQKDVLYIILKILN